MNRSVGVLLLICLVTAPLTANGQSGCPTQLEKMSRTALNNLVNTKGSDVFSVGMAAFTADQTLTKNRIYQVATRAYANEALAKGAAQNIERAARSGLVAKGSMVVMAVGATLVVAEYLGIRDTSATTSALNAAGCSGTSNTGTRETPSAAALE